MEVMESKVVLRIKFYQNLGKLFYAVAAADRVVRDQEINRLDEIVRTEWTGLDDISDDFGVNAVHQIRTIFLWLKEHDTAAETCLQSFKLFKEKHPLLFTDLVIEKIWHTVNAIASAFSGKNKSELIILNKIVHLFEHSDH